MRLEIPGIEEEIHLNTAEFPADKVVCLAVSDSSDNFDFLKRYWAGLIPPYNPDPTSFTMLYETDEMVGDYGYPSESTWMIIDQDGRVALRLEHEYDIIDEVKQTIKDLIQ